MIYLSVRKEYICRISKINSAMELEIGGTILSFGGIITGLATFIIIGGFHPIVIKAEYYFGTRCWWVFLVSGIAFAVLSLFIENSVASTIVGVVWLSPASGPSLSSSSRRSVSKKAGSRPTRRKSADRFNVLRVIDFY